MHVHCELQSRPARAADPSRVGFAGLECAFAGVRRVDEALGRRGQRNGPAVAERERETQSSFCFAQPLARR